MGSENTTPYDGDEADVEWASRLFEEHADFVRSVIRFLIRNPSDWDDFFQDLYLSFVRNAPAEIRNPRGFLYRLAVNRAKDWYRNNKRWRQWQEQEAYRIDRGQEDAGLTEVFCREEVEDLYRQIETYLSQNEARAILYRFKYKYTLDQTARKMGLHPRTISRYVCVGLRKIRSLLQNNERSEEP